MPLSNDHVKKTLKIFKREGFVTHGKYVITLAERKLEAEGLLYVPENPKEPFLKTATVLAVGGDVNDPKLVPGARVIMHKAVATAGDICTSHEDQVLAYVTNSHRNLETAEIVYSRKYAERNAVMIDNYVLKALDVLDQEGIVPRGKALVVLREKTPDMLGTLHLPDSRSNSLQATSIVLAVGADVVDKRIVPGARVIVRNISETDIPNVFMTHEEQVLTIATNISVDLKTGSQKLLVGGAS